MLICFPPGGPWSPFENNWHLKADYKNFHKRKELAAQYVPIGVLKSAVWGEGGHIANLCLPSQHHIFVPDLGPIFSHYQLFMFMHLSI